MRRWFGSLTVGIACLYSVAEVSSLTVTLVNRTRNTIVAVYVSKNPSGWSDDVLRDGAVLAGERMRISFPGGEGTYRLKAVDEDGSEYVLDGRNLRDGITVIVSASDAILSGSAPIRSISILNNTGKAIHKIMLLPEGAQKGAAGTEFLNAREVLLQGEDLPVVIPAGDGGKIFTIQLIDEEGFYYIKTGIDVSRGGKVFFSAKDKKK